MYKKRNYDREIAYENYTPIRIVYRSYYYCIKKKNNPKIIRCKSRYPSVGPYRHGMARPLRVWMGEQASRYGDQLRVFRIRSRVQRIRRGPSAWWFGDRLTTLHSKNIFIQKQYVAMLEWILMKQLTIRGIGLIRLRIEIIGDPL